METSTRRGIAFLRRRPLTLSLAAACAGLLLTASPARAQAFNFVTDHFMCYTITGTAKNVTVQVVDQFSPAFLDTLVLKPAFFCNPTEKQHADVLTPIRHPNAHLEWYTITTPTTPKRTVWVSNQFGVGKKVTVSSAKWLAVPTQKDTHPQPEPTELDHFKCYVATGQVSGARVRLKDQFEEEFDVQLLKPIRLCNPVIKKHGQKEYPRFHETEHLVCYDAVRPVTATNQFSLLTAAGGVIPEKFVVRKMSLCVPSFKSLNPPIPTDTKPDTK